MVHLRKNGIDLELAIVNISRLLEKYDEKFTNDESRIAELEDNDYEIFLQLDLQNCQIEKLRDDFESLCHVVKSVQLRLEFELPQPNWEE